MSDLLFHLAQDVASQRTARPLHLSRSNLNDAVATFRQMYFVLIPSDVTNFLDCPMN
jgi:hypothetical protein